MCYYIDTSSQYTLNIIVCLLYDLGCMQVLGAHVDVYKIVYFWSAIIDRMKLSSISPKYE